VEVYREAGRPEMEAAAIRDVLSFDLGQFSGAFQRLLENNLLPGYRTLLGSTLARAGKFDEAIAHVNALIGDAESDEDRAPLLQLLAGVHQRQRRMDLAEQRLREAHKLTPLEPGINNDLGYTLADRGKDVAEAERMIRLAVGEHPRVAAYLDSLGWVLYKMGDMEGAALWLGRASTLERGQDPVIFDHLGDAYWRLGRKDDAHKAWTRCIELIDEPEVQGWEPPEEEFRDVVRDKLETADSGLEPKAAPLAKESP
jgi:Flp pilus assembly protein TadD